MAALKHVGSGRVFLLRARSWVGRHASADVDLEAPAASIEHATLFWDGTDWWVHDRASRNGTKLNDQPLLQGQRRRLAPHDVLVFGDPNERWRVVDLSAPRPCARDVRSGAWIPAQGDALYLPSEELPSGGIYLRQGSWTLEDEAGTREVVDGEVVALGGAHYRLLLPPPEFNLARTQMIADRPPLAEANARFDVSRDEESVRVTLLHGTASLVLPEWACNYVLLTLARAVCADQAAALAEADVGWLYCDELAQRLASTMTKLNIDVHRARRSVETIDYFQDPFSIVQRRRGVGQMRLGTLRVLVNRRPDEA